MDPGFLTDEKLPGLWKFRKVLPFQEDPVSLGEGGTPLLGSNANGSGPFFKLEYLSPTGSFKDRGAAVSLTRAKAIGAGRVVEDSTGNAGIAASSYSARAGLKARIYVPRDAPMAKKVLIGACGAEVVETTDRREASARAVAELREGDLYIGHTWDPFYIEGMKTVAFEVFEYNFDTVIVPVASGTLLVGIFKGFSELMEMGIIRTMPMICGVQGEGCAPVYEALHGKLTGERNSSLADGLRIEDPPRKAEILDVLRRTGGDVFTVSDGEIASSLKELYAMGIIAEPTSATVHAAYVKNRRELPGKVLLPLTGSGMKTVDRLGQIFK
jgi:threonine synthase